MGRVEGMRGKENGGSSLGNFFGDAMNIKCAEGKRGEAIYVVKGEGNEKEGKWREGVKVRVHRGNG